MFACFHHVKKNNHRHPIIAYKYVFYLFNFLLKLFLLIDLFWPYDNKTIPKRTFEKIFIKLI